LLVPPLQLPKGESNLIMSSPKLYIPFNWPKFQSQTPGWNSEQKWAYWNACCAYYWGGCVGIDNEEETMRLTCECFDPGRWATIRGRVFQGNGYFSLENSKWHQDYAREQWKLGVKLMKKRADQTESARQAAIQKAADKRLTRIVTDSVTDSVESDKSEPESGVVTGVSPTPTPSSTKKEEAAPPPADAVPKAGKKTRTEKQNAAYRWHQFHGNIEVLWKARWRSFFPTIEPRITGPDYNRMDSFLALNPDIKASQIVDLAAAAWKRKIAGDQTFLMKNSNSLAFVCSNYSQIEAELATIKNKGERVGGNF
jgi:hypothetical protein